MCFFIGAGAIEPRCAVSFRSYMNRYSERLGGGPKHLSSTQPGRGLRFCKLYTENELPQTWNKLIGTTKFRVKTYFLSP